MKNEENEDDDDEHAHGSMGWPMKKEFKLAMLDKKEKSPSNNEELGLCVSKRTNSRRFSS